MAELFPNELDTATTDKKYNPRPYLDAVANKGIDKQHVYIERDISYCRQSQVLRS